MDTLIIKKDSNNCSAWVKISTSVLSQRSERKLEIKIYIYMPTDVIKIDVDFFSRYNLAKRVYKQRPLSCSWQNQLGIFFRQNHFEGGSSSWQKPFIWMLHFAFSFKYLSLLILFIMLSEIKSKNVYSKVVKNKKAVVEYCVWPRNCSAGVKNK